MTDNDSLIWNDMFPTPRCNCCESELGKFYVGSKVGNFYEKVIKAKCSVCCNEQVIAEMSSELYDSVVSNTMTKEEYILYD